MKPQAVSFTKLCLKGFKLNYLWNLLFQPTSSPSSLSFYRVNTTNGNTCILIRTDGLLSIQYRDKLNEDKEADVYLPDYPTLSGMMNRKFLWHGPKAYSIAQDIN